VGLGKPPAVRAGESHPVLPPTLIPSHRARLIEIRAVDRETARKNMSSGLVAGGFAAAVFALCFVAAFLYIAQ
jgi:hypothetical protein